MAQVASTSYSGDPAGQQFTIGKIDAGIAVLISEDVHLIEFPSILLPPGVGPGAIVNIQCARNPAAERKSSHAFWQLQSDIFSAYGVQEPVAPVLTVRHTTQTMVTLAWDPLQLAAADPISLVLYRNGERLNALSMDATSHRVSGLALDTDYDFFLVLHTTAGTYQSNRVSTHTHTIEDTSGIALAVGNVDDPAALARAVAETHAKSAPHIQTETTHYVTSSIPDAEDADYSKALALSIPVVTPEWVAQCARAHRMVPIASFYVGGANPAASLSSASLSLGTASTAGPGNLYPQALGGIEEEATDDGEQGSSERIPADKGKGRGSLTDETIEAPPTDTIAQLDDGAAPTSTIPTIHISAPDSDTDALGGDRGEGADAEEAVTDDASALESSGAEAPVTKDTVEPATHDVVVETAPTADAIAADSIAEPEPIEAIAEATEAEPAAAEAADEHVEEPAAAEAVDEHVEEPAAAEAADEHVEEPAEAATAEADTTEAEPAEGHDDTTPLPELVPTDETPTEDVPSSEKNAQGESIADPEKEESTEDHLEDVQL